MRIQSIAFIGLIGVYAYTSITLRISDNAEILKIAAEQKLNTDEVTAFRTCVDDFGNKEIQLKGDSGVVTLPRVPKEICACQGRMMAKILTPRQYGENRTAVKMFGKQNVAVSLLWSSMFSDRDRADFVRRSAIFGDQMKAEALLQLATSRDPEDVRAFKLTISLGVCAAHFRSKRNLETAAAFEQANALAKRLGAPGL